MTQPYGTQPAQQLRQLVKPRLRKITLSIEDSSGRTWTTSAKLVKVPDRSGAAQALGWIVALGLLAGAGFAAAWILQWLVSLVHGWWEFVPEMPYRTAVLLSFVSMLGGTIGAFIKVFISYAIGTSRLPANDD